MEQLNRQSGMPPRRKILRSLIFVMFTHYSLPSFSTQNCNHVFDPIYGSREHCVASVNFNQFQESAYDPQNQSQWCWAASISMVFAYAGYHVDQARIVKEAYGQIVNLPAHGWQLSSSVNRDWIDDSGNKFRSRLSGLYDAEARTYAITNEQIVAELARDRPLIIGAGTHAMVLTQMGYFRNVFGQVEQVTEAGVFDPWPGVGARALTPQELVPIDAGNGGTLLYLASMSISEVQDPGPTPPSTTPLVIDNGGSSGGGGGGGSIGFATLTIIAFAARLSKRHRG